MKKVCSVMLLLAVMFAISIPAFAVEDSSYPVSPCLVMRETVGYDADKKTVNWKAHRVGSVSGDNSKSSTPLEIEFKYDQTDTVEATIGGSFDTEYQQKLFLSEVSASLEFDVSLKRSWTAGRSSGAKAAIDPYKCQAIGGYVPDVSTSGSMKIKVYNDSTPNNFYYEYKPISASKLPARSHIHFVKVDMDPSEFQKVKSSADPLAMLEYIRTVTS